MNCKKPKWMSLISVSTLSIIGGVSATIALNTNQIQTSLKANEININNTNTKNSTSINNILRSNITPYEKRYDLNWGNNKKTPTILSYDSYTNPTDLTKQLNQQIINSIDSDAGFNLNVLPTSFKLDNQSNLEIFTPAKTISTTHFRYHPNLNLAERYTTTKNFSSSVIDYKNGSQKTITEKTNSSGNYLKYDRKYFYVSTDLKILLTEDISNFINNNLQNTLTHHLWTIKEYDIKKSISQTAFNLNSSNDIYIWFKENQQEAKFYAELIDITNNPNSYSNKINGYKNTYENAGYPSSTPSTTYREEAPNGFYFAIKLSPNNTFDTNYGSGVSKRVLVKDIINGYKKTSLNYVNVLKNSYEGFTTNRQETNFGMGKAVNQNFTTNTSGQSFKYDNNIYQLQSQTLNIQSYNDFNVANVLVPKTNENINSMANGVLRTAPSLTFTFNPVFETAIININNLISQIDRLNKQLSSVPTQTDRDSINRVIQKIKNKYVDYNEVETYLLGITTSGVNLNKEPTFNVPAKWYTDAQTKFGLNLNTDTSTWNQFIKLCASYFNKDIVANVTLGDEITKDVKVWDGTNFRFNAIDNTINQSVKLANENQAQIKINSLRFNNGGIRNTDLINKLDMNTDINVNTLSQASNLSVNGGKLTYTYPYRPNFNATSWGKSNSSIQVASIIYQDPNPKYASNYRKDIDPKIVRDSINNYLRSQGVLGTELKVDGVNQVDSAVLNDTAKQAVKKLQTKYNLDLTANDTTGSFYLLVSIPNANDLGNHRREENPYQYIYYLDGLDQGAGSNYLVHFEAKQKAYSPDDIKLDTNGLYVDNRSTDAIKQDGQPSKLRLDTSSWQSALSSNLTNQTITLTTQNPDGYVGFGKYSTDYIEYQNITGTLSNLAKDIIVNYIETLINGKLYLKDEIKFTGSKNSLSLELSVNYVLNEKGIVACSGGGIDGLVEEAKSFSVKVEEKQTTEPLDGTKGVLTFTLDRSLPNRPIINSYDIDYTIKSTRIADTNGYITYQNIVTFDFSKLLNVEYQSFVNYLFTDSSFIKNAHFPLQKILQDQLNYWMKNKAVDNMTSSIIDWDKTLMTNQKLVKRKNSVDVKFVVQTNALGGGSTGGGIDGNTQVERDDTPIFVAIGLVIGGIFLALIIACVVARIQSNKRLKIIASIGREDEIKTKKPKISKKQEANEEVPTETKPEADKAPVESEGAN